MKFFLINIAFAFAHAGGTSLRGNGSGVSAPPPHRVLQVETEGVFLIAESEEGPDARRLRELQGNGQGNGQFKKKTLNVQIDQGTDSLIYEIVNAQAGWDEGAISGYDSVKIPVGAIISGATIDVQGKKPDVLPCNANGNCGGHGNAASLFERKRKLQEQEDASTPEQKRNLAELHRQLAVVEGVKTVLAVRVIHDGIAAASALTAYNGEYGPNYSKETLADDVFGTAVGGGDTVNLHSQYKACSHGKLDFQPATSRTSANAKVTDIVDGVVEVTVSTVCSSTCDGNMRNDVNNALGSAFGTSASNIADHVMHCLPQGAMGGIAYGKSFILYFSNYIHWLYFSNYIHCFLYLSLYQLLELGLP